MGGSRNFRQGWGVQVSLTRKALTTFYFFFFFFFFSPQLILQKSNGQLQRNLSFFKVPEGVQHFLGGGGVQLLLPYRNPYNLWFSRGVRIAPPPLDPHLLLFVFCGIMPLQTLGMGSIGQVKTPTPRPPPPWDRVNWSKFSFFRTCFFQSTVILHIKLWKRIKYAATW